MIIILIFLIYFSGNLKEVNLLVTKQFYTVHDTYLKKVYNLISIGIPRDKNSELVGKYIY